MRVERFPNSSGGGEHAGGMSGSSVYPSGEGSTCSSIVYQSVFLGTRRMIIVETHHRSSWYLLGGFRS